MTRVTHTAAMLAVAAFPASAQPRPDFSGVWTLDPAASRMVGPGGRVGAGTRTRELANAPDLGPHSGTYTDR